MQPQIQLPESLDSIRRTNHFPAQRHRWNSNEEVASILISFGSHEKWLTREVRTRPESGSVILYSRKKVRYRRDGYCWKKRKDGKTTREDHMKLKVQGVELIYGCYVHSAILCTFHRRCYWLLTHPEIVLVHYLNVSQCADSKAQLSFSGRALSIASKGLDWGREQLIRELKPMFYDDADPNSTKELDECSLETIEQVVAKLMAKQRARCKLLTDAEAANPEENQASANCTTNVSSTNLLNNLSSANRKTLNNFHTHNSIGQQNNQLNLINCNNEMPNFTHLTNGLGGNKLIQSILIKPSQESGQEDQFKKVFRTSAPNALFNMQLVQLDNGQLGVANSTKMHTNLTTTNSADMTRSIQSNMTTSVSQVNSVMSLVDKKRPEQSINNRTSPILNTFFLNNCTSTPVNTTSSSTTTPNLGPFFILNTSAANAIPELENQNSDSKTNGTNNSILSISMDQQQFAKFISNQNQMNYKMTTGKPPFTAILYSTVNSSNLTSSVSSTSMNTTNTVMNSGHNSFKAHHTVTQLNKTSLLTSQPTKLASNIGNCIINESAVNCTSNSNGLMMTGANSRNFTVDLKKIKSNQIKTFNGLCDNVPSVERVQAVQTVQSVLSQTRKDNDSNKGDVKIKCETNSHVNCVNSKSSGNRLKEATKNCNRTNLSQLNQTNIQPARQTTTLQTEDDLLNHDQLSIDNGYGSFDDGRTSSNMDCLSRLDDENVNESDQLLKDERTIGEDEDKLEDFNHMVNSCSELDCSDLNANDDVLFSLEAFDMLNSLNEFTNLDYDLNNNLNTSHTNVTQILSNTSNYYPYDLNLDLNSKIDDSPSCSPKQLNRIKNESSINCDNQNNQNSQNSNIQTSIHHHHSSSSAKTHSNANSSGSNQLQNNNRILSQLLNSKTTFSLLNSEHMKQSEQAVKLIDYNPRWIYTDQMSDQISWMFIVIEGAAATNNYQIKFEQLASVHGLLIAPNVLRCRIPLNQVDEKMLDQKSVAEKVKIQIIENGKLVIDNLEFEYRKQVKSCEQTLKIKADVEQTKPDIKKSIYDVRERELKYCLLEKLSNFASSQSLKDIRMSLNLNDFENNVIKVLDKLSTWNADEMHRPVEQINPLNDRSHLKLEEDNLSEDYKSTILESLSIMHLAAALNFSNLIFNLLELQDMQVNSMFDYEVDLKGQDHFNSTPLMWSMARGHESTSKLLISLCSEACSMTNRNEDDCFKVADSQGHIKLSNLARQWLADCLKTNASLRLDLASDDHLISLDDCAEKKIQMKHDDVYSSNYFPQSSSNLFDCSTNSTTSTTISNLNTLINYASKDFNLDDLICDNNSLMNCDDSKLDKDLFNYKPNAHSNGDLDVDKELFILFLANLKKCFINTHIHQQTTVQKTTDQSSRLTHLIEYSHLPTTKQLIKLIKRGRYSVSRFYLTSLSEEKRREVEMRLDEKGSEQSNKEDMKWNQLNSNELRSLLVKYRKYVVEEAVICIQESFRKYHHSLLNKKSTYPSDYIDTHCSDYEDENSSLNKLQSEYQCQYQCENHSDYSSSQHQYELADHCSLDLAEGSFKSKINELFDNSKSVGEEVICSKDEQHTFESDEIKVGKRTASSLSCMETLSAKRRSLSTRSQTTSSKRFHQFRTTRNNRHAYTASIRNNIY